MKNRKLQAVLLWVIYFLNLWIVPQFFIVQNADGQWRLNQQVYILLQVVTAIYAVWSYREILMDGFKRLKGTSLGRDVAIGYVFRIVLTLVLGLIIPLQQSDNQANVEAMIASNSIMVMILLTCIVAPIVEELVFREGIIGAFKDKVHPWVLAGVSMGTFILLHAVSNQGGIDWRSALLYVPLTIPLVGIYRHYKDNVVASIIMHMASNAIAMLFLLSQL